MNPDSPTLIHLHLVIPGQRVLGHNGESPELGEVGLPCDVMSSPLLERQTGEAQRLAHGRCSASVKS